MDPQKWPCFIKRAKGAAPINLTSGLVGGESGDGTEAAREGCAAGGGSDEGGASSWVHPYLGPSIAGSKVATVTQVSRKVARDEGKVATSR